MAAAADKTTARIEVDGRELTARPGAMLIEVTDQAGIYVPRFCYHKHLSVAANCRMCLVEVERAPKPLPACATPVTDGMKVHTRSSLALDAQRSVMEFLLINHPLDCPICDQGGECELQDLAMGFGRDVSRYQERKRVVPDRDIGPLVRTDLTRCIHCTRCVRFGEEIAGLRELGTLNRGEHLEIGTYVERAMRSELSGNVIDLCPVGALTSMPFRYSARAWEMREVPGIAPHDAVGSNVRLHVASGRLMRVVPGDHDEVNETWLSDRDRFSYQGLYHPDRLTTPMVRDEQNILQPVDWEVAFDAAARGLQQVIKQHDAAAVGALVAPSATLEEAFLMQQLVRGLGSPHVDHRLRQADFSADAEAAAFPWLGCSIAALEDCDAALLIGAHPRTEQPLINHRLRKAALGGAAVCRLVDYESEGNFAFAESIVAPPSAHPAQLAQILQAIPKSPTAARRAADHPEAARRIAARLAAARRPALLLGESAFAHPDFAMLCRLAARLASACGGTLGFLAPGANSAGAWLAGAVPHRGPLAQAVAPGYDWRQMFEQRLHAYVLLGIEPELDCLDGSLAGAAMRAADFRVCLAAYKGAPLADYADVLLPIAQYAETPGTLVNAEGRVQRFTAAASPPGQARPAWKVLRMLGNRLGLADFDYRACDEIYARLADGLQQLQPDSGDWGDPGEVVVDPDSGKRANCERCGGPGMYAIDALVRHADALQQTGFGGDAMARVAPDLYQALKLDKRVRVQHDNDETVLEATADAAVPPGCVHIHGARPETVVVGPPAAAVRLSRA